MTSQIWDGKDRKTKGEYKEMPEERTSSVLNSLSGSTLGLP